MNIFAFAFGFGFVVVLCILYCFRELEKINDIAQSSLREDLRKHHLHYLQTWQNYLIQVEVFLPDSYKLIKEAKKMIDYHKRALMLCDDHTLSVKKILDMSKEFYPSDC